MQATVTKLLDKAGSDPRLTPRILREKAEQRMNLLKGDLKPNRERIKDIIYEWWRVRKSAEEDRENGILKSVCMFEFFAHFLSTTIPGINTTLDLFCGIAGEASSRVRKRPSSAEKPK